VLTHAQVEGAALIPLDNSAATPPAVSRTWFVALVTSLVRRATGKAPAAEGAAEEDGEDSTPGTPDSEGGPSTGGARAVEKAGGRRRATKRR
jgi:DnaJ family protein C protein 1